MVACSVPCCAPWSRYNHLDPDVRKDKWTQEEDCIIVAMQKDVGNSWASISKILKGRTPNSVKV